MKHQIWVATATTMLVAVACQPDRVSAPPAPGVGAAVSTTTNQVSPMRIVIFASDLIGADPVQPNASAYIDAGATADVDRTVTLSVSNGAVLLDVPTTVTIPAGQSFVGVGMKTATVAQLTPVTVTASGAGAQVSAVVNVYPSGARLPSPVLSSITVSPGTVAAGAGATATITLTAPAPAGGLGVVLGVGPTTSGSAAATMTVPAGATTASFPIQTFVGFPNSTTTVTVEGCAGTTCVTTGLNVVTGATAPAPLGVASITLDPSTVVGGSSSTATVTLTGAAPSGGTVVTLQSTNTAVATVPTSVTVVAGAQSANFPIGTSTVSALTSSNIAASVGTGSLATTLTVTPPPSATPPPAPATLATPSPLSPAADTRLPTGSTVAFDWGDVSGAVSYTIQIGDKDTFPSPLVATQTVTASQATLSGLPTETMWWRVRANAPNGTSSGWSAVRRFELKS